MGVADLVEAVVDFPPASSGYAGSASPAGRSRSSA